MDNNIDIRCSISENVKNNILPQIDSSNFLGFVKDERITLYVFAAALAVKIGIPPKSDSCNFGLVRMSSVSQDALTQMMLLYLSEKKKYSLDDIINDIGELRNRKGMITELNKIADAGFMIVNDFIKKPEDIVIAKLIKEMDEMYKEYQGNYPEFNLPPYSEFDA
jgi:hypothetical protein